MTKQQKILAAFALIVLLVLVGLLVVRNQGFRLTGTTPGLGGDVPTSTGTIKLSFSKEIDDTIEYADGLQGDAATVKSMSVEGSEIYVNLGPLIEDVRYTIELTNIRAKTGEVIAKVPLNFKAVFVPFNDLPKDQQELEIGQTDKENVEDPILSILPYEGDRFYLSGENTANEAGEPIFVLDAQLFLTRADMGTGRKAAIAKYKLRVRDYLESKGFDIDKYLVRYDITEPPTTTD